MRLHAYLLLATFALAARAATIPDNAATIVKKKLDTVSEEKNKAPENVVSEQELDDITNIINDEDNKLKVKPVEIPVEIVVQKVDPILKSSEESEEIIRPPVDLRNSGPPQRQEHETQNPAFDAAEQQVVQVYKQNLNDAQVVLKQGFQGVSEGIQNLFQNNEQIQMIQNSIQTLGENFKTQINKLNGTIQTYLNGDSSNNEVSPAEQQTKAELQVVETGLKNLKNDFSNGVQTLANGIGVFASLRADNVKQEENNPSTGTTPASTNPPLFGQGNVVLNFLNDLNKNIQSNIRNMTQNIMNIMNQGQATTLAAPSAGAQSDTPVTAAPANPWLNFPNPFNILTNTQTQNSQTQNTQTQNTQTQNTQTQDTQIQQTQPGLFGSGNGPIVQAFQNMQNRLTQLLGQTPAATTPPAPTAQPSPPIKAVEPTPVEEKPSEQPAKPDEPIKPEEQIKSIIPGKPRDEVVEASAVEPITDIKTKGHIHFGHNHHDGAGDNNDGGERLKASEPEKEMVQETVPEAIVPVQEMKEEATVQKTEEVVDKTE